MVAPALRHLIMIVPGIGGSELVDPAGREGEKQVWWSGRDSIVAAFRDPDRLALERDLVATSLLRDFTVVPLFKSIDGYTGLCEAVQARFSGAKVDLGHPDKRIDSATIVGFPYDFRLGVDHAAQRLQAEAARRVNTLGESTTVMVIAHSMGGLVARRWAACYDSEHRCKHIVTLGTPFRGAMKALDMLQNGLYWGIRPVQRRKLSQVVGTWPGLHDLVPIDDRITDTNGDVKGAWELAQLEHHAEIVSARDKHVEVRSWWADEPQRPSLYMVSGVGHEGPTTAKVSGARLSASRERPSGELPGDGTVSYWSSVPPEMTTAESVRPTADNHGAVSNPTLLPGLLDLVNSGAPPPTRGPDDSHRSFAGFDVESLIEPGQTLTGTVVIDGQEPAEPPDIQAELVAWDGTRTPLEVATGPDGAFTVDSGATDEGRIELTARLDSAGGRRNAADQVIVLRGDE